MEYYIDNRKFDVSYRNLKEEYERFSRMSDNEFMASLPKATHLACIICYLKEVPTSAVLSDTGLIHELVHLMDIGDENVTSLYEIRELFKTVLKLA